MSLVGIALTQSPVACNLQHFVLVSDSDNWYLAIWLNWLKSPFVILVILFKDTNWWRILTSTEDTSWLPPSRWVRRFHLSWSDFHDSEPSNSSFPTTSYGTTKTSMTTMQILMSKNKSCTWYHLVFLWMRANAVQQNPKWHNGTARTQHEKASRDSMLAFKTSNLYQSPSLIQLFYLSLDVTLSDYILFLK